jgi:hypothetical protein
MNLHELSSICAIHYVDIRVSFPPCIDTVIVSDTRITVCHETIKIYINRLTITRGETVEKAVSISKPSPCFFTLLSPCVQSRSSFVSWPYLNPLTPELNPSAQLYLTRFFTGDFAS